MPECHAKEEPGTWSGSRESQSSLDLLVIKLRIAVHVGSTNPIEKILPVLGRSKTNHDPYALSIVSPIYMGHEKAIRKQKNGRQSARDDANQTVGGKNLMGKWRWRKYMKTPSCSSQSKTKRWVGLAGAPDLSNLNRLQRLFDTRYSTRFMNRHVKILIRGRAWCNTFMEICESEKS